MASEFKIGATLGGITSLDILPTPVLDPTTDFKPYSKLIDLGSGLKRGAGYATAKWIYGYITEAQRNQLRTFCTGASAEVFIRTRTRDTSGSTLFKTFKAVMTWPEQEDYRNSRRTDFIISFSRLEVQT